MTMPSANESDGESREVGLPAPQPAPRASERPLPPPPGLSGEPRPRPRFWQFRSQMLPIRRWEPKCNHSNMARLYHAAYKCDSCGRTGHFGWVYRCVMDRDPMLMSAKMKRLPYAWDDLGRTLGQMMSLGKFGADVRSQKYSLLKEMTEEQMRSYSPAQLETLLAQRDNVQTAILQERFTSPPSHYARQKYPDNRIPWAPANECQDKLCQDCHSTGKDKSWLSLNGVLNGDIPPQATTGFSFSHIGVRPEADAEVVSNIGCRAVPLPLNHPARALRSRANSLAALSLLDIVDGRIEPDSDSSYMYSTSSTDSDDSNDDDTIADYTRQSRGLPRSAAVHALPRSNTESDKTVKPQAAASTDDRLAAYSIFEEELIIRPPWTPPPSPFKPTDADERVQLRVPGLEGRSDLSLKLNHILRSRVFGSVPGTKPDCEAGDHQGHVCGVTTPRIPYQTEEMCDVGLVLSIKPEIYANACATPLPKSTMEEDLYFAQCKDRIMSAQGEAATVRDGRCDIACGVALTEEAVESGTDDMVAHMATARQT